MTEKSPIPTLPQDNPFRQAARVVIQVNRKALEILRDQ